MEHVIRNLPVKKLVSKELYRELIEAKQSSNNEEGIYMMTKYTGPKGNTCSIMCERFCSHQLTDPVVARHSNIQDNNEELEQADRTLALIVKAFLSKKEFDGELIEAKQSSNNKEGIYKIPDPLEVALKVSLKEKPKEHEDPESRPQEVDSGLPSTDSTDLYVRGQHLLSQTASSSDDEFEEYPDLETGLETHIKKICKEAGVGWADIYRHPVHSHKLILAGKGVSKTREKIQSLLTNSQSKFLIFLQDLGSDSGHVKELGGSSTFLAQERQRRGREFVDNGSHATCELIMKGTFHDDCTHYQSYVAVVPAHFILDKDQKQRLSQHGGVNSEEIEKIRDEVSAKLRNRRHQLAWHNAAQKMVALNLGKVMLSFHYNAQIEDARRVDDDAKMFMNDTVLFELTHNKSLPDDKTITESDIECAMSHTVDEYGRHIQLDQIVPIKHASELKKMAKKKIAVKVGSINGWMMPAGPLYGRCAGAEEDQRPPGLPTLYHVLLVLKRPCQPGDSGTIVYVMDKDNTRYYRLGMLHGSAPTGVYFGKGYHGYIATVLSTTVSETKHEFAHILTDLSLAGCQSSQENDFESLLPMLKTYTDIKRERIAAGRSSTEDFTPQCEICHPASDSEDCESSEEVNNVVMTERELRIDENSLFTVQTNTAEADLQQSVISCRPKRSQVSATENSTSFLDEDSIDFKNGLTMQVVSATGGKGNDEFSRESGFVSNFEKSHTNDTSRSVNQSQPRYSQSTSDSGLFESTSELGAQASPHDHHQNATMNSTQNKDWTERKKSLSATPYANAGTLNRDKIDSQENHDSVLEQGRPTLSRRPMNLNAQFQSSAESKDDEEGNM